MPITSTFTVSTEAALNTAIEDIDIGGAGAARNTAYATRITGSISLTSALEAIDLESGRDRPP